jgi:hypothetical protein
MEDVPVRTHIPERLPPPLLTLESGTEGSAGLKDDQR